MLRRSPLRRRVRVGAAARRRVKAGGKLAVGRPSATLAEWRATVADLRARCEGRCEHPACRRRTRLDPHHIKKRSAGSGDGPDALVMLCRDCHDMTEAAYHRRRLVVQPLGGEAFRFALVVGADKWTAQVLEEWVYQRPRRAA